MVKYNKKCVLTWKAVECTSYINAENVMKIRKHLVYYDCKSLVSVVHAEENYKT